VYRIYPTADNSFFLAVTEDSHWQALCSVLGRSELKTQSFVDAKNAATESPLGQQLAALFTQKTTNEWIATLDEAGVPCAPILPLPALFEDKHIAANDLLTTHTHPQWGDVQQTGVFTKFSRTPAVLPYVAPMLGQHTAEVLREVAGYSQEKVYRLLRSGAIQQS
jgi:CoA:oxalate CoA-transferase